MSVEFYGESPGKFDSRTLNRTTLSRWTGRSEAHHMNRTRPGESLLPGAKEDILAGLSGVHK